MCELFGYLLAHRNSFHKWRHGKKDKVQVPEQNEMLSLQCTALGFISKNEEYKLENNT